MLDKLPPRERQLVDLLYGQGESTVAQLCALMPGNLSASAVRAMLTRLETKGFVSRRASEQGFLFAPVVPETAAKQSLLKHIVDVFFNGSAAGAATALLGMSEKHQSQELDELERLIAAARKTKESQ